MKSPTSGTWETACGDSPRNFIYKSDLSCIHALDSDFSNVPAQRVSQSADFRYIQATQPSMLSLAVLLYIFRSCGRGPHSNYTFQERRFTIILHLISVILLYIPTHYNSCILFLQQPMQKGWHSWNPAKKAEWTVILKFDWRNKSNLQQSGYCLFAR